ncbi:MAG: Single-stranded DNA-binding protein [Arthrobacter sp.]|nr:Single-stranded DNA-binding protein [Arthrobacter sp.]
MIDSITVRGYVATDVKSSTTTGGFATATFRMASSVRRFDEPSQTWVDSQTNWYEVQAYRQMAGNVACSLRKGQPVIVVGKLKIRDWEYEGRTYYAVEIDAEAIGQDLRHGTANFSKNSGRPVLSLMEQAPPDDESDSPGPADGDGATNAADPSVLIEDTDGGLSSLDLQTGELVDNRP